jgi:hypothetical protein
MANPTITQLAADLAAGRTTSRRLTEEALARIEDPKGEGRRAFVKVWKDQALAAADASDGLRKAALVPSPLAGIPVSTEASSGWGPYTGLLVATFAVVLALLFAPPLVARYMAARRAGGDA